MGYVVAAIERFAKILQIAFEIYHHLLNFRSTF